MNIISLTDMATRRGPEDWFTGGVWLDAASAPTPGAGIFRVFFEPGARTNWHTHPEGQILYVVTGEGRAGTEGGSVRRDRRRRHGLFRSGREALARRGARLVHGPRRHQPGPEQRRRHRLDGARHRRAVRTGLTLTRRAGRARGRRNGRNPRRGPTTVLRSRRRRFRRAAGHRDSAARSCCTFPRRARDSTRARACEDPGPTPDQTCSSTASAAVRPAAAATSAARGSGTIAASPMTKSPASALSYRGETGTSGPSPGNAASMGARTCGGTTKARSYATVEPSTERRSPSARPARSGSKPGSSSTPAFSHESARNSGTPPPTAASGTSSGVVSTTRACRGPRFGSVRQAPSPCRRGPAGNGRAARRRRRRRFRRRSLSPRPPRPPRRQDPRRRACSGPPGCRPGPDLGRRSRRPFL